MYSGNRPVGGTSSRVIGGLSFTETVKGWKQNEKGIQVPKLEYECTCGEVFYSRASCDRHAKEPWIDGAPHPLSVEGVTNLPLPVLVAVTWNRVPRRGGTDV